MIISRLSGGVGNQLFQYAVGRTLASRNNTELKLDIHAFASVDKNRSYILDAFNISASIASSRDFKILGIPDPACRDVFSRVIRVFYRMFEYHLPLQKRKIVLEPSFRFCEDILKIEQSCYLSGVWQSEKYFMHIDDLLRKEIVLKKDLSSEASEILRAIHSCTAVSVHIRRGDYVDNAKTNKFHGVCSPAYYAESTALLHEKVPSSQFFVFSDDIIWARQNLTLPSQTHFISNGRLSDVEELVLMSSCAHNIIANSSFSWWGAWLNKNEQKIVIAPRQWFLGTSDTTDLIPESWLRL